MLAATASGPAVAWGRHVQQYSAVTCAGSQSRCRSRNPSRSTRAASAGASTARRCAPRSSTPPSVPSTAADPQVSLQEIAAEAGTAKPKIYRHFNDKADLFQAIGKRLRDMLVAAIFPDHRLRRRPDPRSGAPQRRRVRQPGRPAPQRPAFHPAGPFPRAGRVQHPRAQRGPRDHHGDRRDVQQRIARDGSGSGRAAAGRRGLLRLRLSGHRLVARARSGQPARGCRPRSSWRI